MNILDICNYNTPAIEKKEKSSKKKKSNLSETNREEEMNEEKSVIASNLSIRSSCNFHMNNRGKYLNEDSDSEPERSNPLWKLVPEESNLKELMHENSAQHKNKSSLTVWEELMTEYEDRRLEYINLLEISQPYVPSLPVGTKLSAVQYLDKHVFPVLCLALKETLLKAKEWDCLMIQKCRFNGLDCLSEWLWNRNPLHPKRHKKHRDIFEIPFVVIWLYYNPRPIFPFSWLWSKKEAITVMQAYVRRYLVIKKTECTEMRQFWKIIKLENKKERLARKQKSVEEIEIMFNEIFDKLIADAVFEAEWKIYGCRCVKKPCHCTCKCMKWCKCCNCYKIPIHEAASCCCSNKIT